MRTLFTSAAPAPPDASLATWQPLARQDQLVMTHVGNEVLVYDTAKHHIHHLNPTSHAVWSVCDGVRTVPIIARAAGAALGADVPLHVVELALGQLAEAHLLAGPLPTAGRTPRQSRRVLLRRVAGAAALPVLVSVSAPTAAIAGVSASCDALGANCTSGSTCCTGHCQSGLCAVFVPSNEACGEPCSRVGGCGGTCPACRPVPNSPDRCFS